MTGSIARRSRVAASAGLLVLVGWPSAVVGQDALSVRGGPIIESYQFDTGLPFARVTEWTMPVVVDIPLPRLGGDLTLTSGLARVDMELAGGTTRAVSGLLDSEARLRITLVRDRLQLLFTGAVPTGTGSVSEENAVLLGPLSNDLLAFAAPTLGTGGAVGLGLAGAVPVGSTSLGYAVNARLPLSYEPVLGSDDEVRAGMEVRGRLGLETPVGRRSFFRVAGIVSVRTRDELNGVAVSGVGNRIAGYASLDTPVRSAVVTLWGSGLYRADPTLEPTALGAAFVPRGTLLAAGARATLPLGPATRFVPEVEVRTATAAPDASGLVLEKLGDVVRLGAGLRRRLGNGTTWLVAHGSGLMGTVYEEGVGASVRGFRASLAVEWTR